jgi:hypothetical protein
MNFDISRKAKLRWRISKKGKRIRDITYICWHNGKTVATNPDLVDEDLRQLRNAADKPGKSGTGREAVEFIGIGKRKDNTTKIFNGIGY